MTEAESIAALLASEAKIASGLARERSERQTKHRVAVARLDALQSSNPAAITPQAIRRAEVDVASALRAMAHWGDPIPESESTAVQVAPVVPAAATPLQTAVSAADALAAPEPIAISAIVSPNPAPILPPAAATAEERAIDALVAGILGDTPPSASIVAVAPRPASPAVGVGTDAEIEAVVARILGSAPPPAAATAEERAIDEMAKRIAAA